MDNLVYTVTQINNYSSELLGKKLSNICVRGEVSSIKSYPSGFAYLTLRDQNCELSCIASHSVVQHVTKGMEISVNGNISIYSIKGSYQLRIQSVNLQGSGNLWKMYLQLKKDLEDEGLFMKKYKKSIPKMPKKVGILSSLEGAVVHDICNILKRRAPYIDIIIRNTKVNGIKSSEDLIGNFNDLVNYNNIDVIIIARGGGSFEDLSCFNNEKLVRDIFNCNIPIVSAVGHETDFTLCDFVSDIRASTPSEAAELVSINIDDLKQNLSNNIDKIVYSINQNIQKLSLVLSNYSKIIKSSNLKHIISNKHNNVHHLLDSIYNMIVSKIDKYYLKIEYNKNIIKNNNIDKIKNMGFSIIRKNNKVISDFNKINIDDDIDVDMKNGNFNATVRKVYGK